MNIRRIISEAIDRTVMANYSMQMKRYLGQYGLDPTPLGTDARSLGFIKEFNNFCFQVTFAIDDKNFKPATNRRPTTPTAPTNNNRQDRYIKRPGDNMATQFVNTTLDYAQDVYHYPGNDVNLSQLFGGAATAFRKGYNDGVDLFSPDLNKMNDKQQPQQQPQRRTPRPKRSRVDLTTLMGNPYVKVINDYRYTKQLSPVLNRVRGLNEVLRILEDIKTALSS